ncbi:MAG: P-loop NTPase [Clostridia bacterium]|nr:P-loop NTPase [Clostridia bacterium]
MDTSNKITDGERVPEKEIRTYLVTSCKGGIGKSTVTANVAMSLTKLGYRILVVDCDFSNRSLDLIFGCEDEVVYDICDLTAGRAAPSRCVLKDRRSDALFFIPAPLVKHDTITPEQLKKAVRTAASEFDCDIVIIDTPGASDDTLSLVAPLADSALIVASHQPTSVRGAEKTGYLLEELGVTDQYLVINRYDGDEVLRGGRPGLNALIDRTHIRLIGVIPESEKLELAQERGKLVCEARGDRTGADAAFDEIARRMCGERLPLMSYLNEKRRRKLLYS